MRRGNADVFPLCFSQKKLLTDTCQEFLNSKIMNQCKITLNYPSIYNHKLTIPPFFMLVNAMSHQKFKIFCRSVSYRSFCNFGFLDSLY